MHVKKVATSFRFYVSNSCKIKILNSTDIVNCKPHMATEIRTHTPLRSLATKRNPTSTGATHLAIVTYTGAEILRTSVRVRTRGGDVQLCGSVALGVWSYV